MARERLGQDSVIARGLQTAEEQLDAETNRIVDETWGLFLDVAQHEPGANLQSLLTLDTFDEDDRECMAELAEEMVSETIYAWVDNKNQHLPADKLALVMAFLGIDDTKPVRGDIPFSDYCLLRYVAYTEEQSRLALAATEELVPDDAVEPDTQEWGGDPDEGDVPAPAPKPRTLH